MAREPQAGGGSLTAAQQATKDYLVFNKFETMDTQRARQALPPQRFAWCENLQILADNQLVVVAGPLPALTNILGEEISAQFYANYNNADYIIAFTLDGAGYQVNIATGVQTLIGPPGTFSSSPDVTQWQSSRILIADPIAGYATWDGTTFTKSGGIAPTVTITNAGAGYVSTPTVAITGGHGSGVTAHAIMSGGIITQVIVDHPGSGYVAGDTLTVVFTGGSPSTSAVATAKIFPIFAFPAGSPPTTLAVFQGRVWIGSGRVLSWTGTGGFDDNNLANASGSLTISDADLVHAIFGLRSLNNYLFIFGDNSIKQIGTITVTGSTTTFTILTLSSDVGTTFVRTVQSFNRLVFFANKIGAYAIFGASVEKISSPMDGVFSKLDFTQPLQACLADISTSVRTYLVLVRYNDPVRGTRSLMLAFAEKRWYVINQGANILSCCHAPIAGIIETFASSGPDITQILQAATTPVPIILNLALADHGKPFQQKRAIRFGIGQNVIGSQTIMGTIDSENGSVAFTTYTAALPVTWLNAGPPPSVVTWVNFLGQVVTWVGSGFLWQRGQASATGLYLGMTVTGSVAQMSFNSFVIEYQDATLMTSKPER
jgi:hypothetical protein